jgi:hypothetical protein
MPFSHFWKKVAELLAPSAMMNIMGEPVLPNDWGGRLI